MHTGKLIVFSLCFIIYISSRAEVNCIAFENDFLCSASSDQTLVGWDLKVNTKIEYQCIEVILINNLLD